MLSKLIKRLQNVNSVFNIKYFLTAKETKVFMLSKLIKRLQNVNSLFNIKLFFNRKRDKSLYAF